MNTLPPKLVICADLLRPNPDFHPNQADNVRRIHALLRAPLGRFFAQVESIDTRLDGRHLSDCYRDAYGEEGDPVLGWARHYEANELPAIFHGPLERALTGSLVIVFEASPALQAFLSARSIPFIDVRLHPARFLDDLVLWFYASDEESNMRLTSAAMLPETLAVQAQALRRRHVGADPSLPDDAVVYLAQCSRDASLILDGRFVSVLDKREILVQRCAGRRTFIKPHPYDPRSINAKEWAALFPDAEWLDINLYAVLATHLPLDFVTISSSAGFEAELLGHRVLALSPRAPLNGSSMHQRYTAITHAYWMPEFWEWVLGLSAHSPRPDASTFEAHRLRRILDLSWSL
jgi:hypothetical protein